MFFRSARITADFSVQAPFLGASSRKKRRFRDTEHQKCLIPSQNRLFWGFFHSFAKKSWDFFLFCVLTSSSGSPNREFWLKKNESENSSESKVTALLVELRSQILVFLLFCVVEGKIHDFCDFCDGVTSRENIETWIFRSFRDTQCPDTVQNLFWWKSENLRGENEAQSSENLP